MFSQRPKWQQVIRVFLTLLTILDDLRSTVSIFPRLYSSFILFSVFWKIVLSALIIMGSTVFLIFKQLFRYHPVHLFSLLSIKKSSFLFTVFFIDTVSGVFFLCPEICQWSCSIIIYLLQNTFSISKRKFYIKYSLDPDISKVFVTEELDRKS